MSEVIYNLSKIQYPDTAMFGGKACNLHKLLVSKQRLGVPKALVIPATASEDQIVDEAAALLKIISRELGHDITFAVRSSAVVEDGQSSSYAGLFDTELDVKFNDIINSVLKVKASASSKKAAWYRELRKGVTDEAMSVIVQPMVEAIKYAGVVFSSHPTETNPRIYSIEMVRGRGDSLVSGKKSPLSIRYNPITRQRRVERTGQDKIGELEYAPVVDAIDDAMQKINIIYGHRPVDVEWAYANGSMKILQVRPITTIDDKKNRNKVIVVAGMTGVGKDFIVDRIDTRGVKIVGWGDKLSEFLKANKDFMMADTPRDVVLRYQHMVCDYVLENSPIIAVCHPIKDEEGEYTFNYSIEKRLNPYCYIYVKAPPAIISRRVVNRNKMGTRHSKEIPVNKVRELQKLEIREIKRLARLQNTKLIIINNVSYSLKKNMKKINSIISIYLRDEDHEN